MEENRITKLECETKTPAVADNETVDTDKDLNHDQRFIGMGKIPLFRAVVRTVVENSRYIGQDANDEPMFDETLEAPTILFTGTVKLHGTNASVNFMKETGMHCQSRTRIITPEDDNARWATFVKDREVEFMGIINNAVEVYNIDTSKYYVTIFFEYCGKGIQNGVSISNLPKMAVMIALKVSLVDQDTEESSQYLPLGALELETDHLKSQNIYSIKAFETYSLDIDFNNPKWAQSKIAELVQSVEDECPVGKALGVVKGDKTKVTGEGIVWTGENEGNFYRFKTKGEQHTTSKVRSVAPVDVEKINSIREFIEYACTENRMEQAVKATEASEMADIGKLIKWVVKDILDEESDTLESNGLTNKEIGKGAANTIRKWFTNKLDSAVGI